MNNQEVIEIIQAGLDWANWTEEQKEAFTIAGEAVKKQIPKKIIVSKAGCNIKIGNATFKEGTKLYKCHCGNWIGYRDSYCRYCGQKLSWYY